jgi:TPR repeat protein
LICPKCGENNSDNFRFCGMCGTLLEARRPAGTPLPSTPTMTAQRMTNPPELLRPPVVQDSTRPANRQVPAISGPSMLGLNLTDTNQSGQNQSSSNQLSPNQPSMDLLRDEAFSGLDSFFEQEQPKTGGRRILLLLVLLAALGGSGWWIYANYLGPIESRKPAAQNAAATPDAGSSEATAPSAAVPQHPSENANASPDSARQAADAEAKPVPEEKPPTQTTVTPPASPPVTAAVTPSKPAPHESAPHEKIATKPRPSVASPKNVPVALAADTGDAEFRKAEALLYGRGVPQNCDEAVKYLKAASAKSNAKARSTFGTMYATGHCAPRDLPTSYLWFAMALRVDPNNQILEKDLNAIWNQMTPPERQMATRMKQ